MKSIIKDQLIMKIFENTLPNTLDTTVEYYNLEIPDAFIITGDIRAMW